MSDELRQIEIETARIKLERERLALEDELKKRQRVEEVKVAAVDTVKQVGTMKGLFKIALYCFAVFILFMLITT